MTSQSHKRALDEEGLRIKLAAVGVGDDAGTTGDPLVADRTILAAFSSCVRGLPASAYEWDISQLLIEGQPVQRQTVVAWLNKAYSQILDDPFEQQETIPECTMTGLAQLLGFADAVGSSKGLLRACLSDLDALCACVTLPAVSGGRVTLQVDEDWSIFDGCVVQGGEPDDRFSLRSAADRASLTQQVASQTEQLLFLAHKLQLPVLVQKLHTFIRVNTQTEDSLLYGSLGYTLTDRVLEAAVCKQQLRELVVNSITTERGGFRPDQHAEQLLQPVGLTAEKQAPLRFQAKFTRDALGFRKGEAVSVGLSLFGGPEPYIKLNNQYFTAQLLVGTAVWDTQSMQALMGPGPAAAAPAANS